MNASEVDGDEGIAVFAVIGGLLVKACPGGVAEFRTLRRDNSVGEGRRAFVGVGCMDGRAFVTLVKCNVFALFRLLGKWRVVGSA